MCTCLSICLYVGCMCMCLCLCVSHRVFTSVYMCVCVSVCLSVCVCICVCLQYKLEKRRFGYNTAKSTLNVIYLLSYQCHCRQYEDWFVYLLYVWSNVFLSDIFLFTLSDNDSFIGRSLEEKNGVGCVGMSNNGCE